METKEIRYIKSPIESEISVYGAGTIFIEYIDTIGTRAVEKYANLLRCSSDPYEVWNDGDADLVYPALPEVPFDKNNSEPGETEISKSEFESIWDQAMKFMKEMAIMNRKTAEL